MCGATECAETIHPQLRTARPVRLLTGSLPYSRAAATEIQWTGRERPALLERLTILMSKMPSLHLTNWPPAKGAVDPTHELLQHHPLQQGTDGGPDDSYPHPSRNYRESSPPPSYSSLNLLKVKKREEGNPKRNKDIANLFN